VDTSLPPPDPGSLGGLVPKLGLEFLEVTDRRVVARIPVEGNTQPYGLLHGGATAALCETIGSVGTAVAAGPDSIAVGMELNINHLRAVRSGHVTGIGEALHVGRSTAVWDLRVEDDQGRLVAVSRLTLAIRVRPAQEQRLEEIEDDVRGP
jgi:1,4-dihydroxy-2-naphthoyl-CoA hydrolase